MPYKKVKLAEECAIHAFGIDRDYYFKFRSSRRREIVSVRHIICALCREHTQLTWTVIANGIGLANHATAIWGAKQCKNLSSYDKEYAKIYQRAKELYLTNLAEMDNNH